MILKLGMKDLGMELYKVHINRDPGMTLKIRTHRYILSLMGKNRKMLCKWTEDLCL